MNNKSLWLVVAFHACLFYAVVKSSSIFAIGWKGLFAASESLLPTGAAFVFVVVVNGLLSADMKARIVFLRWNSALPGHRAFSRHMHSDPRISPEHLSATLGKRLPKTPADENRAWYAMYREIRDLPEVLQAHRDFLFMRDFCAISFLMLVAFGLLSATLAPRTIAIYYALFLFLQFVVVGHVARTYGIRFVCTVLAIHSVNSGAPRQRATKAATERAGDKP
jgi:hypothetical protein